MMSIYALQNIPKAFNRQYLNRKRDKEKEKMRRGKREEGGRKKKKKKKEGGLGREMKIGMVTYTTL
jgi:hypothetical protein